MLIDTHCHLDFPDFEKDRQETIERAQKENIRYIINIGTSVSSSVKSIEISQKHDFIFATAGIHPTDVENISINDIEKIDEIAKNPKIAGIGEVGLDFHYSRKFEKKQREFFTYQIELAEKHKLPLVIHQREAEQEIKEILENRKLPEKIVFHCFSGDEEMLGWCMKKGFYISFTGIVTFPKASNVHNLVKIAPLDRIFIETDAPFLAPVPFRGKRNEPSYVRFILEKIAQIKQMDKEKIEDIIFRNSLTFFKR
ncbi:MAG: TatD family hydrolase [Candidatus Omnitrophica bacterium]|nr:TatD family hydrolase [Candidatus Omnitrophota bacterium]